MKELRVLSLFTGCGGMDVGFEGGFTAPKSSLNPEIHNDLNIPTSTNGWIELPRTNFKTVFANDIKKSCKIAWENYFQRKDVFHLESIVDIVKKHKEGKFNFPDNIDVVTGGFPCQDFSVAGKRNGFNSHKTHENKYTKDNAPEVETRGMLYYWMREVIAITKPKIFIAENVKGLVSLGNVKQIIENDFKNVGDDGYIVLNARVLNAKNYGVPQNRERVIFIGLNKSYIKEEILEKISNNHDFIDLYPEITHSDKEVSKANKLKNIVSVKEALKGLKEPNNEKKDLSQMLYSKAKWMGRHCQGQIEVDLNGVAPTIRAEHHGNIEFRRLSPDNGGKYNDEFDKGLEQRRLTVRECARIQTFPDSYDFVLAKDKKYLISASEAYKLVGNAVPPLLAYNLAKRIEKLWPVLFKTEQKNDYIKKPTSSQKRTRAAA